MVTKFGIRKTKVKHQIDKLPLALMYCASLIDAFIFFLSLGCLTSNFRADFIFSDWFTTWEERQTKR